MGAAAINPNGRTLDVGTPDLGSFSQLNASEKIVYSGLVIGGKCIAFSRIEVNSNTAPVALSVPTDNNPFACVISFEFDPTSEAAIPIRMREDSSSSDLTSNEGMPIFSSTLTFESRGKENIANLKFINTEAGKTNVLSVAFYE